MVVAGNEFPVRDRLREDGIKLLPEVLLPVVCGECDGDHDLYGFLMPAVEVSMTADQCFLLCRGINLCV